MAHENFFEISHTEPSSGSMYEAHCHIFFEIHFLTHGKRTYFVGDKSYIVEKGDIILSSTYKNHKFETIEPYEQYIIRLHPSTFTDFFVKNLTFLSKNNVLETHKDNFEKILIVVKRIYDTFNSESANKFETIYVDFCYLIHLIYKYGENKFPSYTLSNSVSSPNSKILALKISQYVKEHFTENFSLETLEKEFFTSKVWLTKIFKETTNSTVFQYKMSLQIQHAKKLIENGVSLNKIYALCGFKSKEYFNKVFKKEVGLSPKHYSDVSLHVRDKEL